MKIRLVGYLCERCGHKWVPRSYFDNDPLICPKCKSAGWNKPKS